MAEIHLLRPVVDSSLLPGDRHLLALAPAGMAGASEPRPARPRWGGRTWWDVANAAMMAVTCGFLPVIMLPFLLRWAGLVVGVLVQAGLVATWVFGGLGHFLLVGTGLQVICLLIFVARCGEGRGSRLGRRYHGRYYLDHDFNPTSRSLVVRAQEAVTAVLDSRVSEAGLLDDMANALVLPEQEWEIGKTCAELTRIEQELRGIVRRSGDRSQVEEVLRPQWADLELSAQAVEWRVVALEQYAERTKAANAAYREWRALEELEVLRADTQELLARTVRDDLAVAQIDGLAEKTPMAQLRRAVDDALRAGLELAGLTGGGEPDDGDAQDGGPGRKRLGKDESSGRREATWPRIQSCRRAGSGCSDGYRTP